MGYIEGICMQSGTFSIHSHSFDYQEDPCPKCGGFETCDILYSDSFTETEINQIMKDYSPSSNIFPGENKGCLLYTSPSPRDAHESRMPSSA